MRGGMGAAMPPGRPRALEAAGTALGVAALALLSIHLARQPGSVATVWFANAWAMAVLRTAPLRRWPLLLGAAAAGNLGANLASGDALLFSLGFLPANLAEIACGAVLLHRRAVPGDFIDSPGALLRLLCVGALLPQWLGATLGAAVLAGHGLGPFERLWLNWYVGDVLGALAALPLALSLCLLPAGAVRAQLATPRVAALTLLGSGAGLMALSALPYPFVYLSLPLLAGAVLGTPLASFALCFLALVLVVAALDYGVFAPPALLGLWKPQVLVFIPAVLAVVPAQFLAVLMERLRLLNQALSAITSSTSELASFIDRDGIYRIVNHTYEDYWQRPRGSIVGRHVSQLLPAHVYEQVVQPRLARALAGQASAYRAVFDFPARGLRTMDVSYSPARDPQGQVCGVLVLAHDVHDLAVSQQALEHSVAELHRANEGLEQFVRMSSHDLREPLNTIVQFSDLIESEHSTELSASARQYFDLVRTGSQRLRRMLDDLLDYVRLDHVDELPQEVALSGVLDTVRDALAARIAQQHAHLVVEPLPGVLGRSGLLELLFQNLLSNALKFVPPGRVPEVRVWVSEQTQVHVVVTVTDNGIGIAPSDQALLFQPFKRLHAKRRFEGTGLGLAICRRIATALGGSIRIESAPQGIGSSFHVCLQLAAAGVQVEASSNTGVDGQATVPGALPAPDVQPKREPAF